MFEIYFHTLKNLIHVGHLYIYIKWEYCINLYKEGILSAAF
jgi:hypothetical protein